MINYYVQASVSENPYGADDNIPIWLCILTIYRHLQTHTIIGEGKTANTAIHNAIELTQSSLGINPKEERPILVNPREHGQPAWHSVFPSL